MKSKRSKAWNARRKLYAIAHLRDCDRDFAFELAVMGTDAIVETYTLAQLKARAHGLQTLIPPSLFP